MANININRNVTDMFYRYKMPKVIVKVEGKGNGIKTRIVNMSDIAKALDRPPSYTTKYFGCELGAQTTIDHKTDKYIVNGSHTADKMQDILDGFIQKFVLCPKCENPETVLTVLKSSISQKCMACGAAGPLKIVHRLTQYIQKNPPATTNVTAVANNENGAKKAKGKRGNKKDGESDEEKGQAGEIIAQNYQDAADRNREQDSPPPAVEDSDEEWAEDEEVTTDGVNAGVDHDSAIGKQLSTLTVSSAASEKSHGEKLESFFSFVEELKNGKDDISLHHKELLAEAERLDIVDKATMVLTEVLFNEEILKQLTAYRSIFLRFCHKNPRAQRNLLHSLEMLICQRFPQSLLPKAAHVLKGLYDKDIVDEAVLIEWHDKSSKKRLGKELSQQLHNKAEPFIKWLKEAEEEDDESEEESEGPEVELEFSYQATAGLKETKDAPAKEDEDDDLDIDNI